MTRYIMNGWSFSMPRPKSGILVWHTIGLEEAKLQGYDAISCIGHHDLAEILTNEFGYPVKYNRENIKLNVGDVAIICYLKGGRLPEGTTKLPDDVELGFVCAKILEELK